MSKRLETGIKVTEDNIENVVANEDMNIVILKLAEAVTQKDEIIKQLKSSDIASFHVNTEHYLGSIIISKKKVEQSEKD